MNVLSNEPPLPETETNQERAPSQRVMLVSILLLISAFLLTSAMLFHYAPEAKTEDGAPVFSLTALKEKAKTAVASFAKLKPEKGAAQAEESDARPRFFNNDESRVKWPRLTLTGFGKSAGGTGGFAIINGKQVMLNQHIDKVKLVEIQANSVVVEYMGEQMSLSVNLKE